VIAQATSSSKPPEEHMRTDFTEQMTRTKVLELRHEREKAKKAEYKRKYRARKKLEKERMLQNPGREMFRNLENNRQSRDSSSDENTRVKGSQMS
jgi:hypothetical protein